MLVSKVQDQTDKIASLNESIRFSQQALTYYNVEDSPTDWARIRSNLGDAFTNLFNATGDGQMLTDAISSYEASLTIHTEEAYPYDYASTISNLATAYDDLAQFDSDSSYLIKAIAAREGALEIYTIDTNPVTYAQVLNNLGFDYVQLSEMTSTTADSQNDLSKAIQAYNLSLQVFTEDKYPDNYTMVTKNLVTAENLLK